MKGEEGRRRAGGRKETECQMERQQPLGQLTLLLHAPPPPGGPWPEGPWTQFWSWQPLARGSAHSAHSVFSSSSREGIFFPFLFPFLGHSACAQQTRWIHRETDGQGVLVLAALFSSTRSPTQPVLSGHSGHRVGREAVFWAGVTRRGRGWGWEGAQPGRSRHPSLPPPAASQTSFPVVRSAAVARAQRGSLPSEEALSKRMSLSWDLVLSRNCALRNSTRSCSCLSSR